MFWRFFAWIVFSKIRISPFVYYARFVIVSDYMNGPSLPVEEVRCGEMIKGSVTQSKRARV